jgi:hypothetical protein
MLFTKYYWADHIMAVDLDDAPKMHGEISCKILARKPEGKRPGLKWGA